MKMKRVTLMMFVLCVCLCACLIQINTEAAAPKRGSWSNSVVTDAVGSNVPSSGKPQLTWEAVDGAEQYYVFGKEGTSYRGTVPSLGTVTATSWIHESAEPTKTYTYFVQAIDAEGAVIGWSNVVTIHTFISKSRNTVLL